MLKCSGCGAMIPQDEMICPSCGKEVQLVANYETIESRAHAERQKKLMEAEKRRREAELAARELRNRKRKAKKRLRMLVYTILLVGALIITAYTVRMQMRSSSFDFQYNKALECYKDSNYNDAFDYIKNALAINPVDPEAYILLGEIYEGLERPARACEAYEMAIAYQPDNEAVYDLIVPLYMKLEQYEKLQTLFANCSSENILFKFQDYIAKDPVFSMESGEYSDQNMLTLSNDQNGRIYYTIDDTEPTNESFVYTAEIILPEGRSVVKAIYISPKGAKSKVVTKNYSIKYGSITAPKITPSSGVFSTSADEDAPKITIEVPDGCTAYYSFDVKVTDKSNVYTGPISMRSGSHIFYAMYKDKKGKLSDIASVTYVYKQAKPTYIPRDYDSDDYEEDDEIESSSKPNSSSNTSDDKNDSSEDDSSENDNTTDE